MSAFEHAHGTDIVTRVAPSCKWFCDLVQLHRWDKLGRNPHRRMDLDKQDIIDRINSASTTNKPFKSDTA